MNTKYIITPNIYRHLNPDFQFFFKSGECYLAFQPEGETLHLCVAIGKGLFGQLGEIHKMMKLRNFRYLKWVTSVNNRTVQRLSDYGDAKLLQRIPNFYGEGEDGLEYLFDIQNNKRFDKISDNIL